MNIIPAVDEALAQLPDLCWKGKVAYVAFQLSQGEHVEPPVSHIFLDKQYVREVWYPPGIIIIGREHLVGHELQLVKGKVILFTEGSRADIEGPYAIHTKPGFQAVAYAVSQCLVRTVHPNEDEERDVSKLEEKWFGTEKAVLELGKAIHLRLAQKSLEAA